MSTPFKTLKRQRNASGFLMRHSNADPSPFVKVDSMRVWYVNAQCAMRSANFHEQAPAAPILHQIESSGTDRRYVPYQLVIITN